jgi:hypothetical protein
MNHCESLRDALEDAALGCTPSEALVAHIAQCSSCTAELDRRRALAFGIDAAVVAIVNAQPSSRLAERIIAQTRNAPQIPPSNRAWPRIAVGVALAASVTALIIGLRETTPPATHDHDLSALSAWHSPTATLMMARGSVLAAPLRDSWFEGEPETSLTRPTPGVSHAL